jgi:hypothetical protein
MLTADLAFVEVGLATRPSPDAKGRRSGGSQHPNHAGDRLSRVDVVFEVASERYPLDERAATRMAENLRVKAAHEPAPKGPEELGPSPTRSSSG